MQRPKVPVWLILPLGLLIIALLAALIAASVTEHGVLT
jgi:hypothetical protein